MKEVFRQHFDLRILFLVFPLMLFSCVKEDALTETVNNQKPDFNIKISNWDHLEMENQQLREMVDQVNGEKSLKRIASSQRYGFTINVNKVQVIDYKGYKTYVFMVFRDDPQPNVLENYVLKRFADNTYRQYLLKYNYHFNNDNQIIFDKEVLDVQRISDEGLFNRVGCVPELVESFDDFVCTYNETCTGPGSAGNHEVGDECECQESIMTCYRAGSTTCEIQTVYVYQDCPGGTNDNSQTQNNNNDSTTGGGSNDSTDNDQDDDDMVAIPFLDLDYIDPCPQMTEIGNTPQLRSLFMGLKVNAQNLSKEVGYTLKKQPPGSIPPYTGSLHNGRENEHNLPIDYVANAVQFDIFAHTHFEGGSSIFSSGDFQAYYTIITNNLSQNGNELVFIVITEQGTKYAMRINNRTKFDAFAENYLSTPDKFKSFETKMYDLYVKDGNSVDDNEKAFLKMMDDLDLGMTLFKGNSDFSQWNELSLVNGNVIENNCNN
ncbi:hypothetical protein [Psychroserpens algicola]|uniref:Lipoprotein n=1 Tax=Psychroserpens algicola TaxID=1719034 RepID=A0ABT0H3V1_9FLAO|nr:hypothetical protein [Psychroserpens algicola]MCK8479058.1 hypothetical protein [Psychroserpens algicola]